MERRHNMNAKNKLNAQCNSFNNMFQVWQFSMGKFTLEVEGSKIEKDSCQFLGVPHDTYKMERRPNRDRNRQGGRGGQRPR